MSLSDACKTALRQSAWDQMMVWLRLRAIKEQCLKGNGL